MRRRGNSATFSQKPGSIFIEERLGRKPGRTLGRSGTLLGLPWSLRAFMCIYTYMYREGKRNIYIYREREREREKERPTNFLSPVLSGCFGISTCDVLRDWFTYSGFNVHVYRVPLYLSVCGVGGLLLWNVALAMYALSMTIWQRAQRRQFPAEFDVAREISLRESRWLANHATEEKAPKYITHDYIWNIRPVTKYQGLSIAYCVPRGLVNSGEGMRQTLIWHLVS